MAEFKQEPHRLLVIPGPIEVADDVLYANAHPSMAHTSPEFIPVFGDCIRMIRDVLYTKDAQPFLISGSGTLGWDQASHRTLNLLLWLLNALQVASNLVEPGEDALVLNTGYFGDSFADCLETYGAKVASLKAKVGGVVASDEIEAALKSKRYKIITVTHVDTSTGVLSDIESIAAVVKKVSPETLVILDGVCSVASELIKMDEWGIDVVMTASQKGLGTPPGLSILVASNRAIKTFENRVASPSSYYASWKKWLPIMRAYEQGTAAYFATPPVNLIYAFNASLTTITKSSEVSLEERFKLHKEASRRIKAAAEELGLNQVPHAGNAANAMTALYFPEGYTASDILPRLSAKGVVVAGGLHKDIKDRYFRIGHMGISVVKNSRGDMDKIIDSLRDSMKEARASKQ
ncbi:PLP-dependent transferase [Thelephora terrestris]|uniref:alanine--glyoxylate transaminase n=1 Tax=Thelephora terrestris TaxID=56493 RepID=A0A9P6HG74_9AGAM|nr:PLP-dependent transferase [Thelephora terrestris]